MRRRSFIAGVPLAAMAELAWGQQADRTYRIGVLSPGAAQLGQLEAFRDKLRDLGYVEGKNIAIDWRFAGGGNETLPGLARELAEAKVDVIVTINTQAAQAAQKASATIPIVFVRGADPVTSGLVASLARPSGNVTGISALSDELSGKRLELLKEVIPGTHRVAALWNGGNPGAQIVAEELAHASRQLGWELLGLPVQGPRDFSGAFEAATRGQAGALVVIDDDMITTYKMALLELAKANHLPVTALYREFAEAGALFTYGPNIPAIYRRAAYFVDRILKGTKPQDLPVEQPNKLDLIINSKTAKTLGLTFPPSMLVRADEVIE
jgi:putative ABC transport system substrate-binding protein